MKSLKNQIVKFSGIFFLPILMTSCAKEEVTTLTDKEKPTLTWLKEIESLIPLNITVQINFNVEDNEALKSVKLTVTNTTSDSVYLSITELTNEKNIILDKTIITKISTTMADFVVKIEAEDQAGNKESFTKNFHVMDGESDEHDHGDDGGGGGTCG
ncbi:MAG: hypothetical protein ACLGGV_01505 [Bacteroidia bacterium]